MSPVLWQHQLSLGHWCSVSRGSPTDMLTRMNRILGRQDGEHREIRGRQKEDDLQSPCHTSRNKWFWRKHRTARKASSTPFFLTEQEQQLNQEHQRLEENLQSLLKQKELFTRQRDLAVKLQHHFTVSQMRFETLQQELEQTTAQEESLLQMELLVQKHYVPGKLRRWEEARDTLKA
nr:trichohyalin-like [Peromyscus maniculatus bairdii]